VWEKNGKNMRNFCRMGKRGKSKEIKKQEIFKVILIIRGIPTIGKL
jgi:hypothetical protein